MFITRLRTRPDESPSVRLLRVMRLGSEDIDINREGHISPTQKKRLELEFGFKAAFIGTLSLILIVASFEFFLTADLILLLLLLLSIAGAIAFYVVHRHKKNLSTGEAVAFKGRIKKHHLPKQWLLIVIDFEDRNERIYKVDSNVYETFIEGDTYTIYSPSFWLERVISAEHHPA
jgi:hypothetical protein